MIITSGTAKVPFRTDSNRGKGFMSCDEVIGCKEIRVNMDKQELACIKITLGKDGECDSICGTVLAVCSTL